MTINHSLRIGITDCGKFNNYQRWINSVSGVEVVKLGIHNGHLAEMDTCNGFIFTGGEDVHPALYGKPEYVAEYGLKEISTVRDRFEMEVVAKALNSKKPVLGICRGLQLINVYLGGSLVPDIPAVFHSKAHGKIDGIDQNHLIGVETDSLLYSICRKLSGFVNSAHHQSAGETADLLRVSAYSDDSIVEALEWKDTVNNSWLLMVQWHPERMLDESSPFSVGIKDAFLEAARK